MIVSDGCRKRLGLNLLRSLKNLLDALEAILPGADLLLNSLPFLKFDFTKHVTLDNNDFGHLVDLCINDLVLNGVDCPEFNLFNINLKKAKTLLMNDG